MSGDANPFASPRVSAAAAAPDIDGQSEAERIRRDHIGNEANIKGIGGLVFLGGLANVGLCFFLASVWMKTGENGRSFALAGLMGGSMVSGGLQLFGGIQLMRLRVIGRVLATLALVLGFLVSVSTAESSFAVGRALGNMLIPVLIISMLWRAKASMVFSDRYRLEVIPATPHVKYRTPRWIWILLGLLLLLLLLVIVGAMRK